MATIRVSSKTHKQLAELARAQGATMSEVAAAAVERLWRDRILEETNAAYAALRADPEAWQQELDERAEWHAIDDWERDWQEDG